MQFYTNVTPWGNTLLVREYVNGERLNRKVKYSPTLFCKVIKETNYKTLDGQYVTPIKHDTIKEAKDDAYGLGPGFFVHSLEDAMKHHKEEVKKQKNG